MTETTDTLGRVLATVDYLRVTVGRAAGDDWLPCSRLVADADHLLDVVRGTAPTRGTTRDDVAVSLFVQAYAFRIASVAVGAWLVDDAIVDVDPAHTAIGLGRGRPNRVHLDRWATVPGADTAVALHDVVVDRHLAVLVECAHGACRVGEALLWSNIGAGFASAFGAFMGPLPERRLEIRDRFEAFLTAARPELAGSGRIVPVGSVWAWERSACCLWDKTESGFRCEDCSLWSPAERQARYDRVLAEAP